MSSLQQRLEDADHPDNWSKIRTSDVRRLLLILDQTSLLFKQHGIPSPKTLYNAFEDDSNMERVED